MNMEHHSGLVTIGLKSDEIPDMTLTVEDAERYGAMWIDRASAARRHHEGPINSDRY